MNTLFIWLFLLPDTVLQFCKKMAQKRHSQMAMSVFICYVYDYLLSSSARFLSISS